jgi:SAM-dependent methyltransferase
LRDAATYGDYRTPVTKSYARTQRRLEFRTGVDVLSRAPLAATDFRGEALVPSGNDISEHYGSAGLSQRIVTALKKAGKSLDALTVEDLAPLDQFHTRGLAATRELVSSAGMKEGWRILDVGSGLGGPARVFASQIKCHVTGVDITPEFCDAAALLSTLTSLEDVTEFRHADATALPFDDARFDLVYTIQVQMSIEDKKRFYGEIFRVLKPGGRFAFQDIMSGPGGEIVLPVPWATRRESSFLITRDELRAILNKRGYLIEKLDDISADALAWRKRQPAAAGLAASPLGLHVVMGEPFASMQANQVINLEQHRVTYVRGVVVKPM